MHLPQEKTLEGKYVIQTEGLDLNAVQAVEAYKELMKMPHKPLDFAPNFGI